MRREILFCVATLTKVLSKIERSVRLANIWIRHIL